MPIGYCSEFCFPTGSFSSGESDETVDELPANIPLALGVSWCTNQMGDKRKQQQKPTLNLSNVP